MTNATWTDRKHLNTALKAALDAIYFVDCDGPLVDQLVDQLLELKAANKAAARDNGRPVLVQS